MMASLQRAWERMFGPTDDRAPAVGIAIVVAATAVVLAAGWVLAALTSLVY